MRPAGGRRAPWRTDRPAAAADPRRRTRPRRLGRGRARAGSRRPPRRRPRPAGPRRLQWARADQHRRNGGLGDRPGRRARPRQLSHCRAQHGLAGRACRRRARAGPRACAVSARQPGTDAGRALRARCRAQRPAQGLGTDQQILLRSRRGARRTAPTRARSRQPRTHAQAGRGGARDRPRRLRRLAGRTAGRHPRALPGAAGERRLRSHDLPTRSYRCATPSAPATHAWSCCPGWATP